MRPPRKPRYTIGQLMVVIAGVACSLAIIRLVNSPYRLVVVCLVGFLATFVMLNRMVEMVLGKRCPACSRGSLRRLARHRRYYRCSVCRTRFKRIGFGPLRDASGTDDAARYRKATEAGIWKAFAVPEKLDGSTS